MAILKIARMGHPILGRKADPVPDPTAPEIRRLVEDMIDTMIDAPGQGLAAPQVHESLQLVIYLAPPDQPGEAKRHLHVLVNPVIEALGEEKEEGWEGCLSVPGLRGLVPRWRRIRCTAQGLDGATSVREVEGHHARVIQHECDHLDGILYPQRMTNLGNLVFESEMKHRAVHGPVDD